MDEIIFMQCEKNMEFVRELPTAQEIKRMYPLNEDLAAIKEQNDKEIAKVFKGESDKLILIIGPYSADREDAVVDYIKRLRKVQEMFELCYFKRLC